MLLTESGKESPMEGREGTERGNIKRMCKMRKIFQEESMWDGEKREDEAQRTEFMNRKD